MRIAVLYPVVSGYRIREDDVILRSVDAIVSGLRDHRIAVQAFPVSCSREQDGRLFFNSTANLQVAALFEKADSFQIIHNHCGFFPLGYSELVNTPIVSTLYHSPYNSIPAPFMDRSLFIGVSDQLRARRMPLERVIYPGIPFPIAFDGGTPREYLVCPAGLNGPAGIETSIDIAGKAGLSLIVCGGREEEKQYLENIAPGVNGGAVTFSLVLDNNQRFELCRGAMALLAYPDEDPTASLEVVEAMAAGTPVIACRRGCLPELVDHGTTGYLTQTPDDAAKELSRISRFDHEGCWSRAAERFSARRMVDDYLAFFREVDRVHRSEGSRPWGFYTILANQADHKVKRIVVLPGARLSLQRHNRRREHWYIHTGTARVTVEDRILELGPNDSVDIPCGALHRIENTGTEDLVFFEVQAGDYFGEDDIERLEDDFGRE